MKTYQSPVGLMTSPVCRWFLEQKWAEAFAFFFQSYSIDVRALNMFERESDIVPPTCSFLLQHIGAPLLHFSLKLYIASITISTLLNQVYLLRSTPLRLYGNLLAFNGLPLNTNIDWMNVRVLPRNGTYQAIVVSQYICIWMYVLQSQSFASHWI